MSTSYFNNFDNVLYRFGDNESPVVMPKLTQYVAILEDTLENAAFYNLYNIIAGERPDTLSYKLYGTTEHYWTFFLLNEHLRESGWPLPAYDLLDETKGKYPYRTVTTNDDISTNNGSFELFPVGQKVTSSNRLQGTIIRKIPEMGQLIIDTGIIPPAPTEENPEVYINTGTTPNTQGYVVGKQLTYVNEDGTQSATIVKESEQYNSVHHYEDADGVWQDFTLGGYPQSFNSPNVSWKPVTYRDRVELKNDDMKQIIIVKPSQINSIVSEFKKLMNQRL